MFKASLKKYLTVCFENKAGENFKIKYELYEHSLIDRWILTMQENKHKRIIENDGHFYGKRFSSEKNLEDQINNSINTINLYSDKFKLPEIFIPLQAKIPMTVEFLNIAHGYFERIDQLKKLKLVTELKLAIMNLNIAIHKAEQFTELGEYSSDHVQVLVVPQIRKDFNDEDYLLFDRNIKFGELYLSYGTTGVPTREAFTHDTPMLPQSSYSSGMQLCFLEDLEFKLNEELDAWLVKNGKDPKDPKLSIGSIPLGKIIEPKIENNEVFLNKLAQYQKVKSIEFEEEKIEANWPFDNEIFYHLDYEPFLDLNVCFDPTTMLEEARKALPYFVTHREYDQFSDVENGRWKSLSLRSLFGDYKKTQYHNSYKFEGEPIYQNSVFAELCPNTMAFLNKITEIEKCDRIRFMILEPGTKVRVHRDSNERDVSFAVNISLNMPIECDFWTNVNPDGTHNKYTKKVPFKDSGSVILFNNAKYHYLENNSDQTRIHIIFHGPIRFTDNELISMLRKQNNFDTKKELIHALIDKKANLGEDLSKSPLLYPDWVSTGLLPNSIPDEIEICIWEHENYSELTKKSKALKHVTLPTIFPLNYKTINENEIDLEVQSAIKNGKAHLILIAAGTYITYLNKHLFYLKTFCQKMLNEKIVLAGHLLDHPIEGQVPYLHEQYLIINLIEWKKNITNFLGPLFTREIISFSNYSRSTEQFHDQYTPSWIGPGTEMGIRTGRAKWGTLVLNELIEKNKTVLNIPIEIRQTKKYSYPREKENLKWEEIQNEINSRLLKSKSEVFTFNNEVLEISHIKNLNPNVFISVAAGFKPFKIIDQYKMNKSTKIHFVDFSKKSLDYIQELTRVNKINEIENLAKKYGNDYGLENKSNIEKHQIENILRESFDSSNEKLMKNINNAEGASFNCVNLLVETDFLSTLLNPENRFVIWISNVYYNSQIYFTLTEEQARNCFRDTVLKIAEKVQANAYLLKNSNTIVFGKDLNSLQGIITDGAARELSFAPDLWLQL